MTLKKQRIFQLTNHYRLKTHTSHGLINQLPDGLIDLITQTSKSLTSRQSSNIESRLIYIVVVFWGNANVLPLVPRDV